MPELPEVEITTRAIGQCLVNKTIKTVKVHHHQLRLPISAAIKTCQGQRVEAVFRRAKYLLIKLTQGHLLIHLGMSGQIRLAGCACPLRKHDHIELLLTDGTLLRYNDPRRFGLWLYLHENPYQHALLTHLGPEPLSAAFNGNYLEKKAYNKQQNIKAFIMRNDIVVGVGNIYATESLFFAGIHPLTPAGLLTSAQCGKLVKEIKRVLQEAIQAGGTTLRDFYAIDGKAGYFAQQLKVYGRKNAPCFQCQHPIDSLRIGGRTTAFCPCCQPA